MKRVPHLLFFLWILSVSCRASDVLFIEEGTGESPCARQVAVACEYYGLDLAAIHELDAAGAAQAGPSLEGGQLRAVVITAPALEFLDRQATDDPLRGRVWGAPRLLVMDLSPQTDTALLSAWTGGAVTGAQALPQPSREDRTRRFRIGERREFTRQLAGQELTLETTELSGLILAAAGKADVLIQAMDADTSQLSAVLVGTSSDGRERFHLGRVRGVAQAGPAGPAGPVYGKDNFLEIAPVMMFLRYACGERCFAPPRPLANLTLDDPWLIQPFGFLDYAELLKQMEKAHFHTTIGLVAWNFDRSKPDVTALFRDHPDRFSVCMHGNNHDHAEFGGSGNQGESPSPAILAAQEKDIRQGVARMEAFSKLTGLPYDRVMVFPHTISYAETLGLLKKYNFLATSNGRNLPAGSKEPNDPLFRLRAVTLDFANFASLRRSVPWMQGAEQSIAMDAFLGNPILFFGHHYDLFPKGIDSFNKTAEIINRIEPQTQWYSLGEVARNLYVVRTREAGVREALLFARCADLRNTDPTTATYEVRKAESFSPPVAQVTLDGRPCPYERGENEIRIHAVLPPGTSKTIEILYENDLDPSKEGVSKKSTRVNWLRRLSDFRDLTLPKNAAGWLLVRIYYGTGLDKYGLKGIALILAVGLALAAGCARVLIRKFRRRRKAKRLANPSREEVS